MRPGRDHETAERHLLSVAEPHLTSLEVGGCHLDLEPQLDHVVVVPLPRLDVDLLLVLDVAAQEALGERWPVVRRAIIRGEDRDELVAPLLAIGGRQARCRKPSADDDDPVLHSVSFRAGRSLSSTPPWSKRSLSLPQPEVYAERFHADTPRTRRRGAVRGRGHGRRARCRAEPAPPGRTAWWVRAGPTRSSRSRATTASRAAPAPTSSTAAPAGPPARGGGNDRIAAALDRPGLISLRAGVDLVTAEGRLVAGDCELVSASSRATRSDCSRAARDAGRAGRFAVGRTS